MFINANGALPEFFTLNDYKHMQHQDHCGCMRPKLVVCKDMDLEFQLTGNYDEIQSIRNI
jgi:hypothetical protein